MRIRQILEADNTEENVAKLDRLEKEVDEALARGEIYKPDYENLKYDINRTLERVGVAKLAEPYLYGSGGKWYEIEEALGELGYPYTARDVLSLRKKLAKVKTERARSTDLFRAMTAFYEKYQPIAEKLGQLKDKIVTATQRREVKKKEKEAIKQQKSVSNASLVKVLKQHMQEYIETAVKMQGETNDRIIKRIEEADWNLDAVAPQPNYRTHGRVQYNTMNAVRSLYRSLLDVESHGDGFTKMKRSPEKEKRSLEQARLGAEGSYLAWIQKMIDKIGSPVVNAEMDGNPWMGSTLNVETENGETQTWNTKMILNFSKYGKMFNQFPSRRKQ